MHRFRCSRAVAIAVVTGMAAATGVLFTPAAEAQTSGVSSATTPRLPDGKPDLNGMWGGRPRQQATSRMNNEDGGNLTRLAASRRCTPNQLGCRDNTNQANDYEFTFRTDTNKPSYRPEHWDRVQFLDYDTNFSDPMFRCDPLGVPRSGPPLKIVQTPAEMIFLYAAAVYQTSNSYHYRIIPTDGRKHNPDAFPTFYGDSIGYWEGDTFVVDAVSFNDRTWLSRTGGYFHSYDLRVIERFRREGDVLHYEVTVEDPGVLLEPWVLESRQLALNADPEATIPEGLPCRDYDSEITVSRIRH